MKKIICAIVLGLVFGAIASATVVFPPVKYGQQVTIYFSIYDSNSPWQYYETAPAADDVYVRKDGGAAVRATNAVTDLDHTMSLVLTATEMQAAVVTVDVNDETNPALFGSETIVIPTFGHASSLQAFDLDTATVALTDASITTSTFAAGAINAAAIASNAFTSDELATTFVDEILDNTLSNNKTKQSLAWYVQRGGGGDPLELTGTAQAGGSTNTIILAADTPGADDAFTPCSVTLLTGTGAWAIRTGVAYNSTTKAVTILDTWPGSTPNATTTYRIQYAPSSALAAEGIAQAGTTNTIQLTTGDVGADNLTGLVQLVSGTGSGATVYAVTDSYDANDTIVISGVWSGATPDTTTYYKFTPAGSQVSDASTPAAGLSASDVTAILDQQGATSTVFTNLATVDTISELITGLKLGDPNSAADTFVGDLLVLEAMVDSLEARLPQIITFDSIGGVQMPRINLDAWNGTVVPAEHTAGYPIVTIKDGTGTGEINTTSGAVTTDITGSYDVDDLMTWIQKTYYNLP